jgi:DNA mismatch repair protein MLH3
LTRDVLRQCVVIGQISKQFLCCVGPGPCVILIDQHAADERVQLERLEDATLGSDRVLAQVEHRAVNHSFSVTGHEAYLLSHYTAQLTKWGFIITVSTSTCQITQAPHLFGITLSRFDLLEYLTQLDSNPSLHTPPPTVVRILHLRACHAAIKFGDTLTMPQCCSLLNSLMRCRLPFQVSLMLWHSRCRFHFAVASHLMITLNCCTLTCAVRPRSTVHDAAFSAALS